MQKNIKFIYSALIITVIGTGMAFCLLFYIKTVDADTQDVLVTTQKYNNLWEGKWVRQDSTNFDNAVLTITNVTNKTFDFELHAFNGNLGNIGSEDESTKTKAVIDGRTATFVSNNSEFNNTNNPCKLVFTREKEGWLSIEESGCDYFKGNAVWFGGEYGRNRSIIKFTTKSTNVFVDKPGAYREFMKLVGDDLTKFDQTVGTEQDDHDNILDADYGIFFMPHNAMTTSVIAIGQNNKIWAALRVWDDKKDKELIYYYTNVSEYKNKIPDIIARWNEKNLEVVYK